MNNSIIHILRRQLLKTTIILVPLLGFTWIIGLFAVGEEGKAFAYLFVFANVFQVRETTSCSIYATAKKEDGMLAFIPCMNAHSFLHTSLHTYIHTYIYTSRVCSYLCFMFWDTRRCMERLRVNFQISVSWWVLSSTAFKLWIYYILTVQMYCQCKCSWKHVCICPCEFSAVCQKYLIGLNSLHVCICTYRWQPILEVQAVQLNVSQSWDFEQA